MSKKSVFCVEFDEKGILKKQLPSLSSGFLKMVEKLGPLGEFVTGCEILLVSFDSGVGPQIEIFFGKSSSHTTDFRFIGNGRGNPTAMQIANHLSKGLRSLLTAYLREQQKEYERMLAHYEGALAGLS